MYIGYLYIYIFIYVFIYAYTAVQGLAGGARAHWVACASRAHALYIIDQLQPSVSIRSAQMCLYTHLCYKVTLCLHDLPKCLITQGPSLTTLDPRIRAPDPNNAA